MFLRHLILLFSLVLGASSYSQLTFPLESWHQSEVERYHNKYSIHYTEKDQFYASHQSMWPLMDKRSNRDSIYFSEGKYYYWITQKLFKENFVIFEGPDFWCAVDPIVDLTGGQDLTNVDSLNLLYWNTRGIRVQAKFFDKVGFTTTVYENQAILPEYQANFVGNHGEFYPNQYITNYTQQNGVIPGYARTKVFKKTGYDFAFATGQVNYVPSQNLSFSLGNGNHFVGNGYRSLLLSDFTANYPFFQTEVNFWNNRIQYNFIYALHQNLRRIANTTTVELPYERNIGTYHYLDIAISPRFQVGLFEGALWGRADSAGTYTPEYLYLNPLPFVNYALKGDENKNYNAVAGINLSYRFDRARLYAQLLFDQGKISGFQGGAKAHDLFIQNLDIRYEFNMVMRNTYLSSDYRMNYGAYNLPLAHPLTSGFNENILQIDYQHNRFFASNHTVYYHQFVNDSLAVGTSILDQDQIIDPPLANNYVFINRTELGYRFNRNYNLQAVTGFLFRNSTHEAKKVTSYFYLGIRTRLKNKTLDF